MHGPCARACAFEHHTSILCSRHAAYAQANFQNVPATNGLDPLFEMNWLIVIVAPL